MPELFKAIGYSRFGFFGIRPFAAVLQLVAVFLCASVCLINVRGRKQVFDRVPAHRRRAVQKNMRVIRSGCRSLVRHAEVRGGQRLHERFDFVMRQAAV